GLGNMGSALARALIAAGADVTVWNRSPGKAAVLVEEGARSAVDAAAAVAASPVVLMCVTDPVGARQVLTTCAGQVAGKLLVQFTTSTPLEAREGEAWAKHHDMDYVQAAITGSPATIGTPDAHIVLAGAQQAFSTAEPMLRALAADLDYKGESVGLAPAWDMVLIMHYYGMFLSLFHSVQICQAEGIPLEHFGQVLAAQGKGYEEWLVENIRSGSYQETSAPLELRAIGALGRSHPALRPACQRQRDRCRVPLVHLRALREGDGGRVRPRGGVGRVQGPGPAGGPPGARRPALRGRCIHVQTPSSR
ncbi:MAG: NAD(P)-binding domain-containing protein, partial [Candidatus Nanopelagicales bacterium]|nr:NAD(P)-binding domain-containing protein [Candidatus Nanopelagicales bacterium]